MQVGADGTIPPSAVAPPKKPNKVWSALKWMGSGVVLGIAGYEGLKLWRRVRGEGPGTGGDDEPREANPAISAGGMPGFAMPQASMMPQVLPVPMPMPYPMHHFAPPMPAPAAAAAPAAEPAADLSPKQRRSRNRERKLEERLRNIEELLESDDF